MYENVPLLMICCPFVIYEHMLDALDTGCVISHCPVLCVMYFIVILNPCAETLDYKSGHFFIVSLSTLDAFGFVYPTLEKECYIVFVS